MQKPNLCAYRFGSAVINPRYAVCGVELKPFSLGHFILLEATGNPLIAKEQKEFPMEETMRWFFSAVLICGMNFDDGLKFINNESVLAETVQQFDTNLRKVMGAARHWNFYNELAVFKEYIAYYFDIPYYNETRKADAGAPSGVDWKQNMYFVMKKLGYNQAEILDMSMRKLFYEWCSFAEAEGAIKVWNKMDLEQLARAKGLIR